MNDSQATRTAEAARRTSPGVKVAIVGGGISGLATAAALLARGCDVTLYEERIHLGGKLGAHPARIPLWQGDLGASAKDFLDQKQGIFKSSSAFECFCTAMENSKVPPFIHKALLIHLRRMARHLKLLDLLDRADDWFKSLEAALHDITADRVSVEKLTTEEDLIGASHKWAVTYHQVRVADQLLAMPISFRIAIYAREDGNWTLELTDAVYHEHCYHMFLNWYRNFWALMDEFGLERSTTFRPHEEVVHVFPGNSSLAERSRLLTTLGDFSRAAENLMSGAAPPPDLFLWMYSMLDLVSHQFNPGRYLDRRSVHAFLSSRWYATEEGVRFHENLLAKAFAVPTFFSSAYTYRKYVEYTMAAPRPMLWVLKGDSYTHLFAPLEQRLRANPRFHLKRGMQVRSISWDEERLRLWIRPSDLRGVARDARTGRRSADDGEAPADADGFTRMSASNFDYVVLAVPPTALARITGSFRSAVPGLASVRKLQSAVTASLDLHFVRTIPDVPSSHMVLRNSALGLTVMDNAQAWREEPDDDTSASGSEDKTAFDRRTILSVAVTDFYKIEGMNKAEATAAIIEDLRRYFDFTDQDIDFTRTYLQMNDAEPLFINEVGSEAWRPGTQTEIPRLFLAGDFCDNDIGIVTVEGAVVSGLLAARAIQAQLRIDRPALPATHDVYRDIPILMPETPPLVNAEAIKALLLPQAAMAYAASKQLEWAQHPERALAPGDLQFHLEQALQFAVAIPATVAGLSARVAEWMADLHARR